MHLFSHLMDAFGQTLHVGAVDTGHRDPAVFGGIDRELRGVRHVRCQVGVTAYLLGQSLHLFWFKTSIRKHADLLTLAPSVCCSDIALPEK